MAWVRIHDGAMGNLKIMRLSDSAFRLWVKGLSYCQTQLTDGLIPREALREMGAKRKDVDALSATLVEGRAPLWEHIEGFGFKVHDYLNWNDSRDLVLGRKQDAKERKEAWKERQRNAVPDTSQNAHAPIRLGSVQSSSGKRFGENPDGDVYERAGRLRQELYPAWFAKWRNGARLPVVVNSLEFQSALSLVETWDDDRLEKLAKIVLTTDEPFIAGTDRSFKIFALKASWADDRLRQWEKEHIGAV